MKIGVFCSANKDISPSYFSATQELGMWIGKEGHSLVWGGCSLGLMETVGRSFLKARDEAASEGKATGILTGVVPQIIEERGKTFSPMDDIVYCSNLSERKDIIIAKSDVLVALPGGIGTLDEIFSVVSSATIGYHSKKMVLMDTAGFWDPLVCLLDHLEKEGMIRGDYRRRISVCKDVEAFASLLEARG